MFSPNFCQNLVSYFLNQEGGWKWYAAVFFFRFTLFFFFGLGSELEKLQFRCEHGRLFFLIEV